MILLPNLFNIFFSNCYVILLHGTIDREVKRMRNAMDGGICRTITLFFDAGDSDDSSPSASSATSSVASLPPGAEVDRRGTTSSDGASVVRCGATCSDGAVVVRCGATCSDGAMVVRRGAICSAGALA